MGAVTHPRTHISVAAQTTVATAGIPRKSLFPPACGIFHGTREAPMEMPGQVPRVPRKLRPMQVGGGTAGDEASGKVGRAGHGQGAVWTSSALKEIRWPQEPAPHPTTPPPTRPQKWPLSHLGSGGQSLASLCGLKRKDRTI